MNNVPLNYEETLHHLQRVELEEDLYQYLLWMFNNIKKEEFLENWHHRKICDALMKVYRGEITYLIINLPPRYTKTEIVIKAFVSWALAKNPKCKFIHLSYSDELALDNSSAIREIVQSDEYQNYWPMELKKDSDAKKKWFNVDGGGVYATATGGQITGFGAGAVQDDEKEFEFNGAILIDDPLKPDDASSDTLRKKPNERFNSTIKSRRNSKKTPVILIMQRLHEEDLAGFLLDGGSEFEFYHLNLPALNEDGPSEHDPRNVGEALWPQKHDEADLEAMRKADANMFAGQMQQRPAPAEGNIFKWFNFYKELPKDEMFYKVHSWDLTFKEKSKNKKNKTDFVVGTIWGKGRKSGNIYLLPHMIRARMGFTDSKDAIEIMAKEYNDYKAILIEDKANGSAIIDSLKADIKRIIEVEPDGSKVERAEAVAPLFRAGSVFLPHPSICPWINDFINELKVFPNGKHDDQVDSTTQAVYYLDKFVGVGKLSDYNKDSPTYSKLFDKQSPKDRRKSKIKVIEY